MVKTEAIYDKVLMHVYNYDLTFLRDMKEANWKNSDKYFHARGNADAAKFGTGGKHAATIIRY